MHEVCVAHNIRLTKKHPTIADFNDALKNAAVIETSQWRFHQHLGDIRNLCDHNKKAEPTATPAMASADLDTMTQAYAQLMFLQSQLYQWQQAKRKT